MNTSQSSYIAPRLFRGKPSLIMSLLITTLYVLLLPTGLNGSLFILSSLLVCCIMATNRATLIAFLLIFGPMIFGAISVPLGFPGLGGKLAGGVGLLLAFSNKDFLITNIRFKRSTLWIIWIGFILVIWYFLGPQTKYCKKLIVGYFINTPMAIIGFSYLLFNRKINWTVLGHLLIISSFTVLAFSTIKVPTYLPYHLLDFAALRQKNGGVYVISSHDLAYLATTGVLLVAFSNPDRLLYRWEKLHSVICMTLGILMLAWTFHRTSIFALFSALSLSPFIKPKDKKRYRFFIIIALIAIVIVIGVVIKHKPIYVTSVFDEKKSIASRLNRSTNWDAALYCINQKTWFGQGLGGYYIPGYSYPGEGTFAHNLFLGLLCDVGVVGFSLIFIPFIPLLWRNRRQVTFTIRSANGGGILPIIMPVYFISMASGDISSQSVLLVIIALICENWQNLKS